MPRCSRTACATWRASGHGPRVATGENKWADLLSRAGGLADFLRQVEALGLTAVPCSVPAEWRDTTELVEGVPL